MLCPKCNSQMGETAGRYQYRECGLDNVWLNDCSMYICPECNLRIARLPDADQIAALITGHLVRVEARLDADSILFLRKAMRLRATELALILGVHRVEISRWENNKVSIDFRFDFKLRMEAIDRVLSPTAQRRGKADVSLIFHRRYQPDLAASEVPIAVSVFDLPESTSRMLDESIPA